MHATYSQMVQNQKPHIERERMDVTDKANGTK